MDDEVYFWHADKDKVFYKLILSFWVCETRHAQSTQNKKLAYLRKYLQKSKGCEVDLWLQMNTEVFYKLIVSLWVCLARYAQST